MKNSKESGFLYSSRLHLLLLLLLLLLPLTIFFLRPWTHHAIADPITSQAPSHPLDSLTFQEILTVRSILSSYPPFSSPNPFPSIHSLSLLEPDKPAVLSWLPGDPLPPRRASATVYSPSSRLSHILSIDLSARRVLRHISLPHPSAYPRLTADDMSAAASAALADARFAAALRSRGLDPSDLLCGPLSPGWFGPAEEGRRLVKVQCFVLAGSPNFYMRPIEGLTAVVDVDSSRAVEVTDAGRGVPVPPGDDTDYRYETQKRSEKKADPRRTVNPASMEQARGRSFEVVGAHLVRWGGWEVHVRPDERAGAVVSAARVVDPESGEWRSVMYKGMASELLVPYMDPTDGWYFKAYMDAGEYGLGMSAMPLVRLNDCPRDSHYMDAVFAAADGRPIVRRDLVCVFERYDGRVAWRHSEGLIAGEEIISSD